MCRFIVWAWDQTHLCTCAWQTLLNQDQVHIPLKNPIGRIELHFDEFYKGYFNPGGNDDLRLQE